MQPSVPLCLAFAHRAQVKKPHRITLSLQFKRSAWVSSVCISFCDHVLDFLPG